MTGDVSEIEKIIIQSSSVFIAGLFFGTTMDIVTEPIKAIVSRIYGYIHPEIRKPLEAAVSRAYEGVRTASERVRKSRGYENANITRKSITKFLYGENLSY